MWLLNIRKIGFELWKWLLAWFFVSLPSLVTMFWLWVREKELAKPSIMGIGTSEFLVYAISFSAPLFAQCFFKNRTKKLFHFTDFIAFIIFLASIVLFIMLKEETAIDKLNILFRWVLTLYIASLLFSLLSALCIALIPDRETIEKANIEQQNDFNSAFDKILEERGVKNEHI